MRLINTSSWLSSSSSSSTIVINLSSELLLSLASEIRIDIHYHHLSRYRQLVVFCLFVFIFFFHQHHHNLFVLCCENKLITLPSLHNTNSRLLHHSSHESNDPRRKTTTTRSKELGHGRPVSWSDTWMNPFPPPRRPVLPASFKPPTPHPPTPTPHPSLPCFPHLCPCKQRDSGVGSDHPWWMSGSETGHCTHEWGKGGEFSPWSLTPTAYLPTCNYDLSLFGQVYTKFPLGAFLQIVLPLYGYPPPVSYTHLTLPTMAVV